LAYAALVAGAAARSEALAQYCVLALCACFDGTQDAARRARLQLALVSSLSALPLSLLAGALERVRGIVVAAPADEARDELVRELFRELLERVGDREKEFVMHWWAENEGILGGYAADPMDPKDASGEGKGKEAITVRTVSRL
jgi:hypothetical protein